MPFLLHLSNYKPVTKSFWRTN